MLTTNALRRWHRCHVLAFSNILAPSLPGLTASCVAGHICPLWVVLFLCGWGTPSQRVWGLRLDQEPEIWTGVSRAPLNTNCLGLPMWAGVTYCDWSENSASPASGILNTVQACGFGLRAQALHALWPHFRGPSKGRGGKRVLSGRAPSPLPPLQREKLWYMIPIRGLRECHWREGSTAKSINKVGSYCSAKLCLDDKWHLDIYTFLYVWNISNEGERVCAKASLGIRHNNNSYATNETRHL